METLFACSAKVCYSPWNINIEEYTLGVVKETQGTYFLDKSIFGDLHDYPRRIEKEKMDTIITMDNQVITVSEDMRKARKTLAGYFREKSVSCMEACHKIESIGGDSCEVLDDRTGYGEGNHDGSDKKDPEKEQAGKVL